MFDRMTRAIRGTLCGSAVLLTGLLLPLASAAMQEGSETSLMVEIYADGDSFELQQITVLGCPGRSAYQGLDELGIHLLDEQGQVLETVAFPDPRRAFVEAPEQGMEWMPSFQRDGDRLVPESPVFVVSVPVADLPAVQGLRLVRMPLVQDQEWGMWRPPTLLEQLGKVFGNELEEEPLAEADVDPSTLIKGEELGCLLPSPNPPVENWPQD